MKQGTQSWCTGTTQRDGMGREVGGGLGMCTHGCFMSTYGKNHHSVVKQLASQLKLIKKKRSHSREVVLTGFKPKSVTPQPLTVNTTLLHTFLNNYLISQTLLIERFGNICKDVSIQILIFIISKNIKSRKGTFFPL